MTKKIKGLVLIVITLGVMILGGCSKVKEMEYATIEDSTMKVRESIKDNYSHDVTVFSQSKDGKIECYFVYWTVPKVTVHLDGTETTKDMIQVHRYNTDGEYVDMAVAYTLEDAMDLFDTNF